MADSSNRIQKILEIIVDQKKSIKELAKFNEAIIECDHNISNLKSELSELQKSGGDISAVARELTVAQERKKSLTTESKKLSDEIQRETKSMANARGSINAYTQKLTELQNKYNALSEVSRNGVTGERLLNQIGETKAKLEEAKRAFDIINKSANTVSDSLSFMRLKLQALTKEFDNLSSFDRGNKRGKELQSMIRDLTRDISRAEQETGRFGRNVGNYAKSVVNSFKTILQYGLGFTTMGQAFATLGTKLQEGIKDVIDYNREVSKLAAILQTTSKNVEDLTSQARLLGSTTKYTASEVVQLQVELAKLGYSKANIVNMTKSVLSFAQATGSELADAASLAGAALRIFNIDSTRTSEVVDAMSKATTSSALSFDYIKTALPIVGGAAETFGFTLEDTLALVGQLANSGMDASMAATATRNIFLKLADSNGVLAQQLGKPVKTLKDLTSGLKELRDKGANLNDVLELTSVRSAVAFTRFLNGADNIDELKESIEDCSGAAAEMAKTMEDNLGGDITRLSSAWQEFMIALNGSQGPLRTAVQWLVSIVDNLGLITRSVKDAMNMRVSKYTEDFSYEYGTYMFPLSEQDIADYEKFLKKYIDLGNDLKKAQEMAIADVEGNIDDYTEVLKEQEQEALKSLERFEKKYITISNLNDDEIEKNIERLKHKQDTAMSNATLEDLKAGGSAIYVDNDTKESIQTEIENLEKLLKLRTDLEKKRAEIAAQENRRSIFEANVIDDPERQGLNIEDDSRRKARLKAEQDALNAILQARKEFDRQMLKNFRESEEKLREELQIQYDELQQTIEKKIAEQERLISISTSNVEKERRKYAISLYEKALEEMKVSYETEFTKLSISEQNRRLKIQHEEWKLRLESIKKGSLEEFELKMSLLNNEEQAELNSIKLRAKTELLTKEQEQNLLLGIQQKYEKKRRDLDDENFDSNQRKYIQQMEMETALVNEGYKKKLEQAQIYEEMQQELIRQARQKNGETEEEFALRIAQMHEKAAQATIARIEAENEIWQKKADVVISVTGAISAAMQALGEEDKNAAKLARIVGLAEVYINQGIAIAAAVKNNAAKGDPYTMAARIAAAVGTIIASTIPAIAAIRRGKFAKGGIDIQGAGTSTSDSIPAQLSKGESVMTARATQLFKPLLVAMNNIAAQPNVTLPTMYSQYNPTQTMANNEGFGSTMREVMNDIHPIVTVKEINDVSERYQRIQVLDNI